MIPKIVLPFDNGFLRALKVSDVHQGYVDGLNDPLVNRYLDAVKSSFQTTASVCNFVSANRQSPSSVLWGVWTTDAEYHVGSVRLHTIEYRHRTANIGICLFEKTVWGRGSGTAAIRAVTRWAMDALGLRWIEAGAYEENIASQRAFLSAGYEWVFDISGKYILEGAPTTVKVYAARG